ASAGRGSVRALSPGPPRRRGRRRGAGGMAVGPRRDTGRRMSRLFVFGLGFSALTLARRLTANGWKVAGTVRSAEKAERLAADGIEATVFDGTAAGAEVGAMLDGADHVLVSIPPGEDGDPVLGHHRADLAARSGAI